MRRNFIIFITTVSLCGIISFLVLLWGHSIPVLSDLETAWFDYTTRSSTGKQLETSTYQGAEQRHTFIAVKDKDQLPPLSVIDIDLNQADIFSSIPPSASDTAVITDTLRQAGASKIFYSTQLSWDQEEEYGVTLKKALEKTSTAPLEQAVIPLLLTRAISKPALPEYLHSSTIDISQLNGDKTALPQVSKVIQSPIGSSAFPDSTDLPSSLQFGFSEIDSVEAPEGKVPLLAIWGDRLLLHHSLISAIHLHKVPLSEISITLGKEISLGLGKPQIPIDEHGLFTLAEPLSIPIHYKADEIMTDEALNGIQPAVLVISTPTEEHTIQQVQQPYSLLSQLYQVSNVARDETFLRLPFWLEVLILAVLTLTCSFLFYSTPKTRYIGFSILALAILVSSYLILDKMQYWLLATPYLLLICLCFGCSEWLSRKFSLRRKNSKLGNQHKKALARFD